jgi:hypothetical protein
MYIKTCNLMVSMTIRIHSPSPHSKVNSGSCHENKIEEVIHLSSVSCTHPARGVAATFPSFKQGRCPIHRCVRIPHVASGVSGFSAWHTMCYDYRCSFRIVQGSDVHHRMTDVLCDRLIE